MPMFSVVWERLIEERGTDVCSAVMSFSISGLRSSSSFRCLKTEQKPFSISSSDTFLNESQKYGEWRT